MQRKLSKHHTASVIHVNTSNIHGRTYMADKGVNNQAEKHGMPFIFNMFLSPGFACGPTYKMVTIETVGLCVPKGATADSTLATCPRTRLQPLVTVEPPMIKEALVHTSVRTDRNLFAFLVTSLQGATICGLSECLTHHHARLSVLTPDEISHSTARKRSSGLMSMEFISAHFPLSSWLNALAGSPLEFTCSSN